MAERMAGFEISNRCKHLPTKHGKKDGKEDQKPSKSSNIKRDAQAAIGGSSAMPARMKASHDLLGVLLKKGGVQIVGRGPCAGKACWRDFLLGLCPK